MADAPAKVARGTAPEKRLEAALRRLSIHGYEQTPSDVTGRPDFYFRHARPSRVAVFVHGCAWHGCAAHYRPHPNPQHGLSRESVARQKQRDRMVAAALQATGHAVVTLWEHEVARGAEACARRVAEALACRG